MRFRYRLFLILLFVNTTTFIWAQKRVACIGDSVTKGYGLKDSTQSYPYQLQQLLGIDYLVHNYGHSGATLLNMGHRPYINTFEYKEALAFSPDIIIISLGLNDTDPRNWPNYSQNFFANYSQLIQGFKDVNSDIEVFICNMTPIFSGHPRFLSGTRDWFAEIQELIPQIAKANHATIIDNYTPLSARIDLFDDYLHPSQQGAQILAHNIHQYLVPTERKLQVNNTFGSHMVLQRNIENTIHGLASSNELLKIEFHNEWYSIQANQLGKWAVKLEAMKAGGPYEIKIYSDKDSVILDDVLFGDVFLASGQSNMAFQLQDMKNAKPYIDQEGHSSEIRIFKNNTLVDTYHRRWDLDDLQKVNDLHYFQGQWELPNADNIKKFSAIAYVFAKEINRSVGIPIGIIELAVGGSNTESWIPRKTLEEDNLLATYIHQWSKSDFVQDFCRERSAKNIELSTLKNQRHPYDPAYNYEAGIHQWITTSLKGVLWYQGESNTHNTSLHNHLFHKLVTSWRGSFVQNLPFYFVQLSSINRPSWSAFRNSQSLLLQEIPNTYMAISSDVGSPTDVHPVEKEIIGIRLANLVKQHGYHMNIQADSPVPIAIERDNGFITIIFNNCKSLKLSNSAYIKDLTLHDRKGNLINIDNSQILKNKIRFQEPETGIRDLQYGYSPYTEGNLVSDSDVPVSTFNLKIN